MNREAITRGIICSVVDRILKEAEHDPERAIRKLVDLGGQFVKGRFQSYFFDMVQTMLEDEESAYYDLARRVTTQVDREALKTLGVNLGYNGCTLGGRTIRMKEAAFGYDIPWALMFRMNGESALTGEEYEQIVQRAISFGVRSFIFYAEDGAVDFGILFHQCAVHQNCAFLLALPSSALTPELVSEVCAAKNLMVALDSEEAEFPAAARALCRARRPYACHRTYRTEQDVADMESGAWARRAVDAGCMFAFAHAGAECPDGLCDPGGPLCGRDPAAVSQSSVILSNYYTDHLFVDRVISGTPCFLASWETGLSPAVTAAGKCPPVPMCAPAPWRRSSGRLFPGGRSSDPIKNPPRNCAAGFLCLDFR